MRSASSRPIARPRPKPASVPAVRPRWKRSKICSRSAGCTPGPRSATSTCARPAAQPAVRRIGSPRGRVAERVVEQDPHHAGDRVRVAAAPARAASGGTTSSSTSRSSARSANSAATARASSPSSTGSERSGTDASRRLRSSSSPARLESRSSSRRARATWVWASAMSSAAVAQVLLEQLHRALEHRQRRAQLVRGGRHERAPRRLLAAQLLLHAPERAGEVADLVAAGVVLAAGRRRRPPG